MGANHRGRKLATAILLLLLGGCGIDSSYYQKSLEFSGIWRIDPGRDANEYTVTMRDLHDLAVNLDDVAEREHFALSVLKHQCPAGQITDDTAIDEGTYALGQPAHSYVVRVRCRPG